MTILEKKEWWNRVIPKAHYIRRWAYTDEIKKFQNDAFLEKIIAKEQWSYASAKLAEEWLLSGAMPISKTKMEISDLEPTPSQVNLHPELLKEIWQKYHEQDGKFLESKYKEKCLAAEKKYQEMYSKPEFDKLSIQNDEYYLRILKLEEKVKDLQKLNSEQYEKLMKAERKLYDLENGVTSSQDYINLEKRNAELEMQLKMKESTIERLKQAELAI